MQNTFHICISPQTGHVVFRAVSKRILFYQTTQAPKPPVISIFSSFIPARQSVEYDQVIYGGHALQVISVLWHVELKRKQLKEFYKNFV